MPLVLCLIGLSAWPNLISHRSFGGDHATTTLVQGQRQMIVKPHVDWFALSPSLALLAASGLLLMVAVFVRRRPRKAIAALIGFAGFVASFASRRFLAVKSAHGAAIVHDAMFRDRWAALAQVLIAGAGAVAVLDLLQRAVARGAHRRVLRPARRGRRPGCRSSSRRRT